MNSPLTAGGRLPSSGAPRNRPPSERTPGPPNRPPPGSPNGSPNGPPRKRPRSRIIQVWRGMKGAALAVAVLAVLGGAAGGYVVYSRVSAGLPDVKGLQDYQPRVMSRVYAGDGRLLEELATERRVFVPIAAVPPLVRNAFLAAEDQNFYTHGGVDPLAILRAAVTDLLQYGNGRRPIGASTITQQVAKNMVLGNEITLSRKLREALLAIRIERTLSKDRILELYLNEIYLGAGAYGVAAAAQVYFDKPLDALTPGEAAFLAALPKAPNNYQPQRFPEAARARRDWVLDRMVDTHAISAEQAAAAKALPVAPAIGRRPDMVTGADYYAEEVRRQAAGALRAAGDGRRLHGADVAQPGAAGGGRQVAARGARALRPEAWRLARAGGAAGRRGDGQGRAGNRTSPGSPGRRGCRPSGGSPSSPRSPAARRAWA